MRGPQGKDSSSGNLEGEAVQRGAPGARERGTETRKCHLRGFGDSGDLGAADGLEEDGRPALNPR